MSPPVTHFRSDAPGDGGGEPPSIPRRSRAPSVAGGVARASRVVSPPVVPVPVWDAVGVCEIANLIVVRRQLGRRSASALTGHLRDRILAATIVQIVSIDRGVVEFGYTSQTLDQTTEVATALADACRRPFDIDGVVVHLDVNIGVAASERGGVEDIRLIEEAESALYESRCGNGLAVRDLSFGAPAFDRLSLTRDLPDAIANGEMFLEYQPKVRVRQQEIKSAEALVRWRHPSRGVIPPGEFITLAEDSGLISKLTLWTLDQVIDDQASLADSGHDLTIFINISGQLLSDAAFVDAVCARFETCRTRIGFEITETAVIRDPDSAIANLKTFASAGINIAIDDYGAGLSSLAYLKQLPAKELKIDKLFVLNLTSSNRDPLIVRSTIDLAHALDMEVTAEGVETPAALALLSVMGCDMVQGYLISRPISLEAFRQYLCNIGDATWRETRQGTFMQPASFWKRA
jgi:EAL domain-containing protein (putative c-di-GMP-specific phosphodiesterase class I)